MRINKLNNQSFCGEIVQGSKIQGIEHLLTTGVKTRMRFAPTGAALHYLEMEPQNLIKIGLSTPASGGKFVSWVYGAKKYLTEEVVLRVIKNGLERMKAGITKG